MHGRGGETIEEKRRVEGLRLLPCFILLKEDLVFYLKQVVGLPTEKVLSERAFWPRLAESVRWGRGNFCPLDTN